MILLGIDTGGTFTDFVLVKQGQLKIHKVLSTPSAPERAILQGIDELGLRGDIEDSLYIVHGSTVATNAVLEGKGMRTVYITNRGFGDLLTIGRQARRELYNLQPQIIKPPVAKELCIETGGRLSAQGELLEPLTDTDISEIKRAIDHLKPQSVAINLLFSFINVQCERQIEAAIANRVFVSRSSKVLPEIKEYERGMATWLNASVGPIVQRYLRNLVAGIDAQLSIFAPHSLNISVMQSAGGTIDAAQAAERAVHMLLSGPAGGLAGAKSVAQRSGCEHLLTFDMGGTSTDVALIDGELLLTNEGRIAGYPVAVPMVDMHTIGAGGGSIAYIDAGGLLQVGPQSAGADPGPACYAKGGTQATVTDANVVLGRLPHSAFLGGTLRLDIDAAHRAIQPLAEKAGMTTEELALGIINVANEHMARALRVMSVQRGIDPKRLTLVSFGGAGGLHVCALADSLAMRQAMAPVQAGVLSALGMLVAPRARHLSRTLSGQMATVDDNTLSALYDDMNVQGIADLVSEGVAESDVQTRRKIDARYKGQSFTLTLDWQGTQKTTEAFHCLHEKRYGHKLSLAVEWVTARVEVFGEPVSQQQQVNLFSTVSDGTELSISETSLYGVSGKVKIIPRVILQVNKEYHGPLIITEAVATTYIEPGWRVKADSYGNLMIQKQ